MTPALLQRSESLSAFLGGCMISVWSILTLDSLLRTALTGFVGAVASYLGTWLAGRILRKRPVRRHARP